MIYALKKDIRRYKGLLPNLDLAMDYILENDLKDLQPGKYVVRGEDVYFNIQAYEPKQLSDTSFESHEKYIDLQLMLIGEEQFSILLKTNQLGYEIEGKEDFLRYDNKAENLITLFEDSFVIFFPEDLHMPCIRKNADFVKKAVFKIKL